MDAVLGLARYTSPTGLVDSVSLGFAGVFAMIDRTDSQKVSIRWETDEGDAMGEDRVSEAIFDQTNALARHIVLDPNLGRLEFERGIQRFVQLLVAGSPTLSDWMIGQSFVADIEEFMNGDTSDE